MRFLRDMNLSPSLAARLREQGHDALHVIDIGQGSLPDQDVFTRASADRRIVITFDLDFGEIAGAIDETRSGLLLLRLRRAGQSYVWNRLQVAIAQAGEALAAGAIVLVEDTRIRVRRPRLEEQSP
jgi:predicted nuclease of predicted toxin-antitoxin system